MLIHLVTLDAHVSFEARKSIFSLKMKEIKELLDLSTVSSVTETKLLWLKRKL